MIGTIMLYRTKYSYEKLAIIKNKVTA